MAKSHRHTKACRSAADILDTTPGLTYRQLDWWTVRGYINASTNRPGYGMHRCWDEDEADVISRATKLINLGFTASKAITVARNPQALTDLAEELSA
jgi:DNA-binding transcriptional MerR regulator